MKQKDVEADDEFWNALGDDDMFRNDVSDSYKDFNKKPPPSGGGSGFGYNNDK